MRISVIMVGLFSYVFVFLSFTPILCTAVEVANAFAAELQRFLMKHRPDQRKRTSTRVSRAPTMKWGLSVLYLDSFDMTEIQYP